MYNFESLKKDKCKNKANIYIYIYFEFDSWGFRDLKNQYQSYKTAQLKTIKL